MVIIFILDSCFNFNTTAAKSMRNKTLFYFAPSCMKNNKKSLISFHYNTHGKMSSLL